MHTTVFEGPIARAMGGVDLAWLVGPMVTVPLYLILAKRQANLRHLDFHVHDVVEHADELGGHLEGEPTS